MSERDYDVGYGKPPKAGQFKPGQSGNPKGRQKGARGLKSDLKAELTGKLAITENGKTIRMTKQQIVLKALVTRAAKGDVKAAAHVLSMTMQMFGIDDERIGKTQLSAADEALLADYLASNAGALEPPADWPTEPVAAMQNDIDNVTGGEEYPQDSDHDIGCSNSDDGDDEYPSVDDFGCEFDDDD